MPRRSILLLSLLLAAAGEAPRPVRVQAVVLVPSRPVLTAAGTVQARTLAELAFRVPGKVVARPVEVGDRVRAGQILAQLDPSDLQLQQEVAEAALQGAQADAANAQADLRRYASLGASSPAYLPSEQDKRTATARMAGSRLAQAQRQAALAQDQRGYGVLRADADGIVTALPVQVGQVVQAGQAIAAVAHTAEVEVQVDVPENRLAAVRGTDGVDIQLWAAPGQALHGRVREVGALADPASRTFSVRITVLDAPKDLLALGMTATVAFGTAGPPVAPLPPGALADAAGKPAVWVLDPAASRAALRPVELAGYGPDGSVLVRAGLREGEQVVTAGVAALTPDLPVAAWAGAAR